MHNSILIWFTYIIYLYFNKYLYYAFKYILGIFKL